MEKGREVSFFTTFPPCSFTLLSLLCCPLLLQGWKWEDIEMANKHTKRCSMSLVIWEMHMKTTVRYHFTHTRMATIKKTDNVKCWWHCGEIRTSIHWWWECEVGHISTLENSLSTSQNVKWRATIWPSISTPTYIPNRNETYVHTKTYTQPFIQALITIATKWKQPKYLSTDERRNKIQ